ncbi:MarR family winged helix-turn-helix transcriptional regulator [Anaerosporobacter faecicola]|uniref:MarR family winged helix-turn-helix transcriptional regulator n=1 Tax=Anaerosporobacter faecicola TaxID=2718714 RepID=UPI00143979EF|nr:MarR family transcriptional regulator [Anaerosporobacter faecicola]
MNKEIFKQQENPVDFGEMEPTFFLIGLLNEFMNRYQTVGNHFFEEISWKQNFAIACISFFKYPPTLKELSELLGSSHQNVKQLIVKLEKTGFVSLVVDEYDKRKQRIMLTEKARILDEKYRDASRYFMEQLFQGIDQQNIEITIDTIQKMDERLKNIKYDVLSRQI